MINETTAYDKIPLITVLYCHKMLIKFCSALQRNILNSAYCTCSMMQLHQFIISFEVWTTMDPLQCEDQNEVCITEPIAFYDTEPIAFYDH